ncbi:MAG TPA: mechanosensitive ion channel family protein [Candidatus Absconditabacterales bacterium]|nr:mechanosensitive ion channel family protein [Candidatus Absconditabacterales bacterium]
MGKEILEFILDYLSTNGVDIAKRALLALVIFLIIYIFIKRIVNKVKNKIEENNIQGNSIYTKRLANLIGKVLFLIGMIFNVLIIFEVIGIDVALLMAGVSLGIGFAMETLISNMVAGFFILTNKKIKIGDFVQLLGTFNTNGTVEEITIRHTIIRTIDKRRLLIPNMTMASTPIKTIKSENLIRGDMEINLPRHVNIDQIKQLLNKTINESENVLNKSYTNTYIEEFNAKGYKFHTVFFVNPKQGTAFVVGSSLREKITTILKKYGISFPYTHIVINVEE